MLYAQWRFRGLDPWRTVVGPDGPPPRHPERIEAMIAAFAIHAAEQEAALSDVLEALAGGG